MILYNFFMLLMNDKLILSKFVIEDSFCYKLVIVSKQCLYPGRPLFIGIVAITGTFIRTMHQMLLFANQFTGTDLGLWTSSTVHMYKAFRQVIGTIKTLLLFANQFTGIDVDLWTSSTVHMYILIAGAFIRTKHQMKLFVN